MFALSAEKNNLVVRKRGAELPPSAQMITPEILRRRHEGGEAIKVYLDPRGVRNERASVLLESSDVRKGNLAGKIREIY